MPYDEILYQVESHVATLTLNRPEKLNAWTMHMEEEFGHASREAASDGQVRVVHVPSGEIVFETQPAALV